MLNVAQYIMHLRHRARSVFVGVCVASAVLCGVPLFASADVSGLSVSGDSFFNGGTFHYSFNESGTSTALFCDIEPCFANIRISWDSGGSLNNILNYNFDDIGFSTSTSYLYSDFISPVSFPNLVSVQICYFNASESLLGECTSGDITINTLNPVPSGGTATSTASTTVYVTNMGDVSFGLAFLIFLQSFQLAAFIYAIFISRKTKF